MSFNRVIEIPEQGYLQEIKSQTQLLSELNQNIRELIEKTPKPKTFLKSNRNVCSSNVANDIIILAGDPVPAGYRGIVEDFNINFTTVAGTVKWVITDYNGANILADIVIGLTNSSSGSGASVIEETQRLAIAGQVAGAGIFSTFCTGRIYKL